MPCSICENSTILQRKTVSVGVGDFVRFSPSSALTRLGSLVTCLSKPTNWSIMKCQKNHHSLRLVRISQFPYTFPWHYTPPVPPSMSSCASFFIWDPWLGYLAIHTLKPEPISHWSLIRTFVCNLQSELFKVRSYAFPVIPRVSAHRQGPPVSRPYQPKGSRPNHPRSRFKKKV